MFFQKQVGEGVSPKGFVPNEEIDSRRTSKLGYFFLILMVIFGVWQGNNLLSAIERSVDAPMQISSCFFTLAAELPHADEVSMHEYDYGYRGYYSYFNKEEARPENCKFNASEIKHGIPGLYTSLYSSFVSRQQLKGQSETLESNISQARNSRSSAVDEYGVSILEKNLGNTPKPALNASYLNASIQSSNDLVASFQAQQNEVKRNLDAADAAIKAKLAPYVTNFQNVRDEYVHDMNIYKLKQFMLSLVFIVPVFFVAWRFYSRLKLQRSEFTIIWGGVVAITSLLLAQVLLVFIYDILPHQLLQKIFAFLQNFAFLFTLLYWLGFILVPLFFGWLIYLIQKKYYNKQAVMRRAFKSSKCPTCSMDITPNMIFCPVCGTTLKTKCASCGGFSPAAGEFCELCGVRK